MDIKLSNEFDGVYTFGPGESHPLYGAVPPQKVKLSEISERNLTVKTTDQQQWNITYTANV